VPLYAGTMGHHPMRNAARTRLLIGSASVRLLDNPRRPAIGRSRRTRPWNNPAMDEPPELQHNGHWRMAVWALRVGYVGLAVGIAGLIVLSLGSTPWVLAGGAIIWLASAAVTLTGFFWSRRELPEPRPGFWSMRFMLIHDTIRAQSRVQRS
jgi:hypothetical protein